MPSRGWFLVVCLMGLVFTILVRFRLGRWLLLHVGRTTASVQVTAPKVATQLTHGRSHTQFPRLFTCGAASRAGPTQQQIDEVCLQ